MGRPAAHGVVKVAVLRCGFYLAGMFDRRGRIGGVILLVLSVLACGQPQYLGGRSESFGPARLHTEYRMDIGSDRPVPVCHVLFVPRFDPDRHRNYSFTGGSGGDVHRYEFRFGYRGSFEVESERLVLIGRKRMEASGRSFPLKAGNVFVAEVKRDGTLDVTQLPTIELDPAPNDVLRYVQARMSGNARVQALKASPTWSELARSNRS